MWVVGGWVISSKVWNISGDLYWLDNGVEPPVKPMVCTQTMQYVDIH